MGTPEHAAVTGFAITADEARQLVSDARAARLALAVGVPVQTLAAAGQIHQWRARQTLDNSLFGFLAEVPAIVVGVLFVAALGIQTLSGLAGLADETIGSVLVAVGALAFVLWLWAYVSARAFIDTATASLTGERATLPQ